MSTQRHPTLTVGLPVYNGERYLEKSVSSLLDQSFTDFELIIADNASTDGTEAICHRLAEEDGRVRYIRNKQNLGAAPNYNSLVPLARGRYFKWAAHDDRCRPDYFKACVERLEADPGIVLAYPSTDVIDADGERLSTYCDGLNLPQERARDRLVGYLRGNFMRTHGMCNPIFGVIRTEALRRTRLIQDFVASDRLLLAHLALLGRYVELSEVLFERRVHLGTSTMANASFKSRRVWFNANANAGAKGGDAARATRFDNHLALRITHFRDLYRAISELVDDGAERAACRRALTVLLVADPKWIWRDVKYSLGYQPKAKDILRSLKVQEGPSV